MTASPPQLWVTSRLADTAGGCVEVMLDDRGYHLRNSQDGGEGPVITLLPPLWEQFVAALLAGPAPEQVVHVEYLEVLVDAGGGLTLATLDHLLRFTAAEHQAFLSGLRGDEFTPGAPAA